MSLVIPTIIQGPAYLKVGTGPVVYVQNDISVSEQVESWNPESQHGPLGERHKSRKEVFSFTPVGMIMDTLLDWFYGHFITPPPMGTSLMTGAVALYSLAEDKSYTWARGGLTKPPGLILKPTATAYGAGEVTAIGKAATAPTAVDSWKTSGVLGTPDATFNEESIISDIYSAALGARVAPYNAMGAIDGFELDFNYQTVETPAADLGIAGIYLKGLSTAARFAPSNLTDDEVDALLGTQGPTAVLPGQNYSKAEEDLVIAGLSSYEFTLKRAGAKLANRVFAVGQHRHKVLEFATHRTWLAGVADPLFAHAAVP
jgi:hypothetical protein